MKHGISFGKKLGLSATDTVRLARLRSPAAVQDFVSALPANYEVGGETCLTVLEVLRQKRAHCIEGALVAACALWMQGRRPLLMDLKARCEDTDHVVALFREGRYWGAISKSNHVWLRWRDPVYRSLRELALSYFHEYTMGITKTLISHSSVPFDLRRIPADVWVSGTGSCWSVVDDLDCARHTRLFSATQIPHLRARDALEMKAHRLVEYLRH